MHATGTFDVDLAPQEADNPQAQAAKLTRISIAKRYHGDLEATGNGEMLATRDEGESGAYVAIELVAGTLAGKRGEFTLVHSAVMRGGVPEDWSVKVVPDSGTGELAGLSGELAIIIEGKRHSYELRYTLPEA